jgi:hypothetical protein
LLYLTRSESPADALKICRSGMKLTSLSTLRNFILNTLQFGDKTADKAA